MTTGDKIKKIRNYRGLTQKQLGERSGIHEVAIRKYELNKVMPKQEQLLKIANALSVPLNTFYEYHIDERPDILPLLFAIDEQFPLKIERKGKKYTLEFDDDSLNRFLHNWMSLKEMLDEGFETQQNYELWKLLCPFSERTYIDVEDTRDESKTKHE